MCMYVYNCRLQPPPPPPHMHTNYTQLMPTTTVCIVCVCMHGEVLVCLLGWSTNVYVRIQTKIRQPNPPPPPPPQKCTDCQCVSQPIHLFHRYVEYVCILLSCVLLPITTSSVEQLKLCCIVFVLSPIYYNHDNF